LSIESDKNLNVLTMVQTLLQDELNDSSKKTTITPSLILDTIDIVIAIRPIWRVNLDKQAITDELIRRFSHRIGQAATLKNEEGHVNWLNATRKKDWKYWQRYRLYLEKKMSTKVIDRLDESTDIVLGLLEDPEREGLWDRRGLVVGHVQSGKTGHYTGLICKAADAGYKIIIVLAGLHNNLRAQTQIRLDEGFLGYETNPDPKKIRIIGVGEIDSDPQIKPNYATNRSEKGDFNTASSRNMGITPEQRPWLFVIKKNKTVLERLLQWIQNHVAHTYDQESGRKIVTNLPLLIIDDEADHASVDTGEHVFNSDGTPDEEHQPTTINKLIRAILHTFNRSAYVGYTATPFANIYIHNKNATKEEGLDLFPSAFIHNLAAPSNYIGPSQLFRKPGNDDRENLVRRIDDSGGANGKPAWMPTKHKNNYIPLYQGQTVIPPSLEEAILSFILACSVRQLRGQGTQHSSMLVHVTRYNAVQNSVYKQIEEYIRHLRQRLTRSIDHEKVLARLVTLWESDFSPITEKIFQSNPDIAMETKASWADVFEILPDVVSDIQVRAINGMAKDALDYVEHQGTGLKVIAVGGDKLARGLTLEGLCTSYFLRASKMYDTLMQMGRWFGYRPGYQDLCRLYTTPDLIDWFGHIADAAEELREEFDLMAESGSTPEQYGLKVASHSVMMVTSPLKMRTAKTLYLSFSGQRLQTVALHREPKILQKNLETAKRLIDGFENPEINPTRIHGGKKERWQGYLWENISSNQIMGFLTQYETHPEAYKVNSSMIAEFIGSMNGVGELTKWTVALIGSRDADSETLSFNENIAVNMLERANESYSSGRYSIGTLMSPRDEAIDLDNDAWEAALALTRKTWRADPARSEESETEPTVPNGPALRKIRGFGAEGVPASPERGLLLLYAIDPAKSKPAFPSITPAIIAFGISFPGSNSSKKVEYKANDIYWRQEYGSAD